MKSAILYNGMSHQYMFLQHKDGKYRRQFDHIIYFLDLPLVDLQQYDLLIVPARILQSFLMEHRQQILDFVQAGKCLVSMGEMAEPWLPNVTWKYCPTNYSWWVEEGGQLPLIPPDPKHRLFDYIDVDDARWHYHGTFVPPAGAVPILNNEHGEAIIYEDVESFDGLVILTTLDPEYHLGQGFIPKVEAFLDGFLLWVYDRMDTYINKVEALDK